MQVRVRNAPKVPCRKNEKQPFGQLLGTPVKTYTRINDHEEVGEADEGGRKGGSAMNRRNGTKAGTTLRGVLGRGTVALAALVLGSSLGLADAASAEPLSGQSGQALANISLADLKRLDRLNPQEFSAMQEALPKGRAARGNVIMVTQIGQHNRLYSHSYSYQGEGNTTVALQKGRGNTAELLQDGSGNRLDLVQQGNGNRADLQQIGDDMYLGLVQKGNGNRYTYRQTASSDLGWYKVYQRGGSEVTVTRTNVYTQ
jgi:hypothetical protein